MTVKEAIKEIIKLKGLSIFDDYKIFNAMLLDLGNSNQKEVNIFKNAVDEQILKFCIDRNLGDNQKIAKIKIRLEDKGFSDKTIDFVIDSFVFAFGWNYMKMQQILNQTDWTCSCGTVNTGNFCSNCGKSKPVPKESSDWTCSCGTINLGNFCSNCGKSKPAQKESSDWTCSCGIVNTGNFCSNCGKSKPVPKESLDWTCSCGTVNTGNFCSNCGKQRGNLPRRDFYEDEVLTPETESVQLERTIQEINELLAFNPNKCNGCGMCEEECPIEAIKVKRGIANIDKDDCVGCGSCTVACPNEAILEFNKDIQKINECLAFNPNKCNGCGSCEGVCPVEAIRVKKGVVNIDEEVCIECAACVDQCPNEAILLFEVD